MSAPMHRQARTHGGPVRQGSARPHGGAGVQSVLRMQRLAGNRAVSATLERREPKRPEVQRACACGDSCACETTSGSASAEHEAEAASVQTADADTDAAASPGATGADATTAIGGADALTTGGGECGATRCGAPAHCPPPFCCPFPLGTANFIKSQIQLPFLAAIGAKVTASVVPVWNTWFNGGAPPSDFTTRFGRDFTTDPTTAVVSGQLAATLPGQGDVGALGGLAATSAGAQVSILPALPSGFLGAATTGMETSGSATEMNFNTIGTAPGNLAGGIGTNEAACPVGATPSPLNDARRLTDVRATLTTNPDGSINVSPTFSYQVADTVDLCPGDCGSDFGVINEQQATIPMSRLEASGVSGDVPFTVDFPSPLQATFTVRPPAPPAPRDITLSASTLFEFGSDTLKAGAEAALIAELGDGPARADLSQPFVIEGHTDSKGTDVFNLGLSQRRAESVARLLERRFPNLAGHTVPVGRGEVSPVAPNNKPDGSDDPDGRRLNRRVELHFSAPSP